MKTAVYKRIATALAMATTVALTGCGGTKNNPNPPINPNPGPITPGIGQGQCVPLNTGQIGFSGQNVYWTGSGIRGGVIPGSYQSIGQIVVGAGGGQGPYNRQTGEASISMNILPAGYGQYGQVPVQSPIQPGIQPGAMPSGATATVQGLVTLTPFRLQMIVNKAMMRNPGMYMYPGGTMPGGTYPGAPYPGTQPGVYPGGYNPAQLYQSICVSGLAMDVGLYGTTVYSGHVFLYIGQDQYNPETLLF